MTHTGSPSAARPLMCLSLAMLLASLGTSIANIALPTLAGAFGATFPKVQWVVIAYLAGLTVFAVIAGRVGDRLGRRRMLIAGLALFSLASLGCGLARDLWPLVAARAVQGVGAAFVMTLTVALVRDTSAPGRVGRAMGAIGTVSALGTALGPSLGGVLIARGGWPAVFLVLVPMGVTAAFLAWRVLPPDTGSEASAPRGSPALRVSGALPGLVANVLVSNMMMATLLVGPFYLGLGLGLPEPTVGLVLSVGPAVSICAGVPSGRLVDRRGPDSCLTLGLVLLVLGAVALAMLPQRFGVAGYIAAIAVLTPGYQLFQAANTTRTLALVPAWQRGAASGLLGLTRNLGLILGASAMGAVFAAGAGTGAVETAAPAAIASGLRLTFLVAAAGGLAALWITRRGR